jgi:hypothetical protein
MGRPTKYKPEYCDKLIEHLKDGLSFEAFAGVIGVNQDSIHEWAKKHPKFSEAKKIGLGFGLLWWEKVGKAAMIGNKSPGFDPSKFNATIWIFTMKNRFGWRDKEQIDHNIRTADGFEFTRKGGKPW